MTKPQPRDVRLAGYLYSETLSQKMPMPEDRLRALARRSLGEAIVFHQEVDKAMEQE